MNLGNLKGLLKPFAGRASCSTTSPIRPRLREAKHREPDLGRLGSSSPVVVLHGKDWVKPASGNF